MIRDSQLLRKLLEKMQRSQAYFKLLFMASCTGLGLLLGWNMAGAAMIPTKIEVVICLDEIFEYLKNPKENIFPIHELPPLYLECELPGCDAILPGTITVENELRGDLVDSVTLDIHGPIDAISTPKASGYATQLSSQFHRFEIQRGHSAVHEIATNSHEIRKPPEKTVQRLLDTPTASTSLTASIHPIFNRKVLKQFSQDVVTSSPFQQDSAETTLHIQVRKGPIIFKTFRIRYVLSLCQPQSPRDKETPDKIHLIDSGGVDFSHEAVVLTNGLVKRTPSASPTWIEPSAFKSTTWFNMPDNRLITGPPCSQQGHAGTEPCTFEISAFSKGKAMALATPPDIPWTDKLGDEILVQLDRDALTVPVRFYVLWQIDQNAPTDSTCSPLTTECMAEQWLETANIALFRDQATGVTFRHKDTNPATQIVINTSDPALFDAGCSDLDNVYRHFGIDPTVPPDAVRVFFTRHSIDYDPLTGTPIRANGWNCQYGPSASLSPPFYSNDIFISTSVAYSTTLAHELGHSLSLEDINDVKGSGIIFPHAGDLASNNLMYSGSPTRNSISQGQSFRANVNEWSTVHQHKSTGRSSSATPRQCQDPIRNFTCPALDMRK